MQANKIIHSFLQFAIKRIQMIRFSYVGPNKRRVLNRRTKAYTIYSVLFSSKFIAQPDAWWVALWCSRSMMDTTNSFRGLNRVYVARSSI